MSVFFNQIPHFSPFVSHSDSHAHLHLLDCLLFKSLVLNAGGRNFIFYCLQQSIVLLSKEFERIAYPLKDQLINWTTAYSEPIRIVILYRNSPLPRRLKSFFYVVMIANIPDCNRNYSALSGKLIFAEDGRGVPIVPIGSE